MAWIGGKDGCPNFSFSRTMDYKLARELKDAGFPQKCGDGGKYINPDGSVVYDHTGASTGKCICSYIPTLSELIEACGEKRGTYFMLLHNKEMGFWRAGLHIEEENKMINWSELGDGKTPKEAVAKLFLALK